MPLYLAIDAGGTSTRCLLADDTHVFARASTGTIKLMRVSETDATARLRALLAEVAAAARVPLSGVTRTCFGLAGSSSVSVRNWATQTIASVVAGELLLCGDEEIALDAAFAGGPGILLIAGTGSNAIGRSPTGALFGAGGWGPVLGDEGSGYWIGLEAIRAALHAQDRASGDMQNSASSSILLREIERYWHIGSLGDLVALANLRAPSDAAAPPDFASLAPVVARCAEQGDSLADEILARAGEELAGLVTLVFRKMTEAPSAMAGATEQGTEIPVAFTGGILTHIAPVRKAFLAHLAASVPSARVRDSAIDPLDGALWRARNA
jgi:glucosamine kinase